MAIVTLQREKYRPRSSLIQYVVSQRVLLRTRPFRVKNPRTAAQQANRSKLRVASSFLAGFQPFVSKGFSATEHPNGRVVGAYQMALGRLLAHGMSMDGGAWRVDYARVELAEGNSLEAFPVTLSRSGGVLRLAWAQGLPRGVERVRLALHLPKRGQTTCLEVQAPRRGVAVEVVLPKWASAEALHVWWSPVARGGRLWGSAYAYAPMMPEERVGASCAMGREAGEKGGWIGSAGIRAFANLERKGRVEEGSG